MTAANYYEILGIGPGADDEQVKQAYRELAKTCHPDRNPGDKEAERRFKDISTAYEAVKDAARRHSYNEFLAFNEGQEKSERRQWSRLAAIVLLLVLGPSAVLYGVIAFDTLPWEQSADSVLVGTQANQSEPRLEADTATESPATETKTARQSPPAAPELTKAEPKAIAALDLSRIPAAPKPEPVQDAPASETQQDPVAETLQASEPFSEPEEDPIATTPVQTAPDVAESPNLPQIEEVAPQEEAAPRNAGAPAIAEPQPKNAVEQVEPAPQTAEARDEPVEEVESSLGYTQPSQSALEETPDSVPEEQQVAAADEAAGGTPQPAAVKPEPAIGAYEIERSTEGEVKASAQLLARLKEPPSEAESGLVSPVSLSSPSGGVQSQPPLPERRRTVLLQNPYETDPDVEAFADCKSCPLMSARQSSSEVSVNFAVSLGEITIAEWNVCVDDGVCAPYPVRDDNLAAPVIGLTRGNAEAYAEWLSAITGKSYRIVASTTSSPSNTQQAQLERCSRRVLDGFDWLNGGPRRNCRPAVIPRSASEVGFRVARRMNR